LFPTISDASVDYRKRVDFVKLSMQVPFSLTKSAKA
jgi:hypothetical protein